MDRIINLLGRVAAILGLLLCVVAVIGRLAGAAQTAGFEPMSVFTMGVGLMVAACLAKLEGLSSDKR